MRSYVYSKHFFADRFDSGLRFPYFAFDVLTSVQTRKRLFSILSRHEDYPGDSSLKLFLRYFNSSRWYAVSHFFGGLSYSSSYFDPSLCLRRVYTDIFHSSLLFLSSKALDNYHELMVSWLSSVASSRNIPFVRSPLESRYSGSDIELKGLNIEFESGLKASYRTLEDRIILSKSSVVIVVPNDQVKDRYAARFRVLSVDVVSLSGFPDYLDSFYH